MSSKFQRVYGAMAAKTNMVLLDLHAQAIQNHQAVLKLD